MFGTYCTVDDEVYQGFTGNILKRRTCKLCETIKLRNWDMITLSYIHKGGKCPMHETGSSKFCLK